MARPRKGHEKHATERVAFRISEDARLALEQLAAMNRRLITDEARAAIDEYVQRHRAGVPAKTTPVPQEVPAVPEPKKAGVFSAIARKG